MLDSKAQFEGKQHGRGGGGGSDLAGEFSWVVLFFNITLFILFKAMRGFKKLRRLSTCYSFEGVYFLENLHFKRL